MSIGKPDLASRLKRDGRDVMKGVVPAKNPILSVIIELSSFGC